MYPYLTAKLQTIIVNGRWQLLPSLLNFPTVAESIQKITLPVTSCQIGEFDWASIGTLNAKLAFQFLYPSSDRIDWASTI